LASARADNESRTKTSGPNADVATDGTTLQMSLVSMKGGFSQNVSPLFVHFLSHSAEELDAAKEYIIYLEQQMLGHCTPTMQTESPRVNQKLSMSADVCAAVIVDALPPPDQCRVQQLTEELREAELQVRSFKNLSCYISRLWK
jgi:hypothetical protein